jgi:EAL domain-containing protein (putative c-di-GMP-specific phosphodiesterase class I)
VARLADGRIDGVEALPRWQRPGLDPLPPERCVELADMTGLILPLGEWLLRGASRDVKWWHQRFTRDISLAVALTAHQSSDADLVSRVVAALDESGLPPERLTLWLPVRALAAPDVADNLRVLADVGVHTGLDGFGTAPDELTALADLPITSVRLARGLVERATDGADSPLHSALRAVSPLVHSAGATVVVDGVHTHAEADWWRAAGADLAVGDAFGMPRPADEMAGVLDAM